MGGFWGLSASKTLSAFMCMAWWQIKMEGYTGNKLHEEDLYSATPSVFNANATLFFFNFVVVNFASASPRPIHPASSVVGTMINKHCDFT